MQGLRVPVRFCLCLARAAWGRRPQRSAPPCLRAVVPPRLKGACQRRSPICPLFRDMEAEPQGARPAGHSEHLCPAGLGMGFSEFILGPESSFSESTQSGGCAELLQPRQPAGPGPLLCTGSSLCDARAPGLQRGPLLSAARRSPAQHSQMNKGKAKQLSHLARCCPNKGPGPGVQGGSGGQDDAHHPRAAHRALAPGSRPPRCCSPSCASRSGSRGCGRCRGPGAPSRTE